MSYLSALVALLPAISYQATPQIEGTWRAWMMWEGYLQDQSRRGYSDEITFQRDGTYKERMASATMYVVTKNASGRYTVSGGTVKLTGTGKFKALDGKEWRSYSSPVNETLRITRGMLQSSPNIYFVRKGSRPPKDLATPPVYTKSPDALKLLLDVQKKYGSFQSYSDEGESRASGGFLASSDKFTTEFTRNPHKFAMHFTLTVPGEGVKKAKVWTSHGRVWSFCPPYPSRPSDFSFSQAFASVLNGGIEKTLIPALLLPGEVEGGTLSTNYKSISLAGSDTVRGKPCWVLLLRTPNTSALRLWVDKRRRLILRASQDAASHIIDYNYISTESSPQPLQL